MLVQLSTLNLGDTKSKSPIDDPNMDILPGAVEDEKVKVREKSLNSTTPKSLIDAGADLNLGEPKSPTHDPKNGSALNLGDPKSKSPTDNPKKDSLLGAVEEEKVRVGGKSLNSTTPKSPTDAGAALNFGNPKSPTHDPKNGSALNLGDSINISDIDITTADEFMSDSHLSKYLSDIADESMSDSHLSKDLSDVAAVLDKSSLYACKNHLGENSLFACLAPALGYFGDDSQQILRTAVSKNMEKKMAFYRDEYEVSIPHIRAVEHSVSTLDI